MCNKKGKNRSNSYQKYKFKGYPAKLVLSGIAPDFQFVKFKEHNYYKYSIEDVVKVKFNKALKQSCNNTNVKPSVNLNQLKTTLLAHQHSFFQSNSCLKQAIKRHKYNDFLKNPKSIKETK